MQIKPIDPQKILELTPEEVAQVDKYVSAINALLQGSLRGDLIEHGEVSILESLIEADGVPFSGDSMSPPLFIRKLVLDRFRNTGKWQVSEDVRRNGKMARVFKPRVSEDTNEE